MSAELQAFSLNGDCWVGPSSSQRVNSFILAHGSTKPVWVECTVITLRAENIEFEPPVKDVCSASSEWSPDVCRHHLYQAGRTYIEMHDCISIEIITCFFCLLWLWFEQRTKGFCTKGPKMFRETRGGKKETAEGIVPKSNKMTPFCFRLWNRWQFTQGFTCIFSFAQQKQMRDEFKSSNFVVGSW